MMMVLRFFFLDSKGYKLIQVARRKPRGRATQQTDVRLFQLCPLYWHSDWCSSYVQVRILCSPCFSQDDDEQVDVFSSGRGNHEAACEEMKSCENEIEDTKAPNVLSPDSLDHDKVAAAAKLCQRVALCV